MRRITFALFLISVFIIGGCNNDSPDDVIDDALDDVLKGGTLLAETSFEGSMLPFTQVTGEADIYTDPTAPDGNRCLRFTFPPGYPSGEYPDMAWICFEQSRTEVKVEYCFKYSDNFFFHPVANKQLYVVTGEHTDFVLSAVDFDHIGGTGINTYMQVGCQDGNINMTELKNPNMANVAITSNIWYKVTLYFKLNKDGQRDGILKLWVDNKQIMDYSDVLFNRGIDANTPFSCLKFVPVWGGVGKPKPNITDYFYIDAVKIWAGPFESDNH